MKDLLIPIHYCSNHYTEPTYYENGKIYTEMEYFKLQKMKQIVKDVLFWIVFTAFVICRAYVFLEYGI